MLDSSTQRGTALLVQVVLAEHANDDRVCWPSVERIAERARIDERSTRRVIRRLVDAGEIVIVKGGGGAGNSNRYRLTPGQQNPDRGTPDSRTRVTESLIVKSETLTLEPINPGPTVRGSVKNRHRTVSAPSRPSRRKPEIELPSDFTLNDSDHSFYTENLGTSGGIGLEFKRFKAWHGSHGTVYRDWHQAWRTWVLKAAERNQSAQRDTNGKAPAILPTGAELAARDA